METLTSEAFLVVPGGEPRTRTALLLEAIALRHQIAVLERSGARRPCFLLWDRLFWILFSHWWSHWRASVLIVQPETVLRWGAVRAGQCSGNIEHVVAGAAGARGFPEKSVF